MSADSDKEPGILDTILSLMDEGSSEYECEHCDTKGSFIIAKCSCGWKLEACLACTVDRDSRLQNLVEKIKEHGEECGEL